MAETYHLPTATVLSAQQSGDVSTVAVVVSDENYLTYPVAPAILLRPEHQVVFHLHQLTGRYGPELVFETYRSELPLPEPDGRYDFGSCWTQWAMDAVRDTAATWLRMPYPVDGEHDHCLLTWTMIAARADHKEGYRSSHGWVTVESFREYIEEDRLRIRSAWKSIERRPRLCPRCFQLGFYASYADDSDAEALWDCVKCGYRATEDRRLRGDCPHCGDSRTRIVLDDGVRHYSYCHGCVDTRDV